MADTENDGQGVLPLEDAGEVAHREPWQVQALKRLGLTMLPLLASVLSAGFLEAAFALVGTPTWVAWPMRLVLYVSFVIPSLLAILRDGWSVFRKQWARFRRWRDD